MKDERSGRRIAGDEEAEEDRSVRLQREARSVIREKLSPTMFHRRASHLGETHLELYDPF